jgi:DNA-binding response OmpR family regulator
LKKGFEQEEFVVDVAFDGETGYDMASTINYDVIILDYMLPGMDGLEVVTELRSDNNHVPILMLTARGEIPDRVKGLNTGADDYLGKPFAFEELLARVRALARRPLNSTSQVLTVGNLSLNPVTFEVSRSGKGINLSSKEFALLDYLMRHQNQILSKDQIIDNVWNYDTDVLPNTVEVYMGYLRNKIDKSFAGEPALIHTVRGFGYKLG